MIPVALIEDDTLIRQGLTMFLESLPQTVVVASVESFEEFAESRDRMTKPAVILLDIGLPGMNGIEALPRLRDWYPDASVIMLTVREDPEAVFPALQAGASGYLLKSTSFPEIQRSLEVTVQGGSVMSPAIARKVFSFFHKPEASRMHEPLTDRESDIVNGLADGKSYQAIADQLFISIETVRHHIKNIYRKLQVNSKAEVIRMKMNREI